MGRIGWKWPLIAGVVLAASGLAGCKYEAAPLSTHSGYTVNKALKLEDFVDEFGTDVADEHEMFLPFVASEVEEDDCPADWLTEQASEVTYGDHGAVFVNGVGFFPLGIYYTPNEPSLLDNPNYSPGGWLRNEDGVWARMHDACLNTVIAQPYGPSIFPVAEEHGIMMLPSLRHFGDELEESAKWMRGQPNLLWTYGWDEPNLSKYWEMTSYRGKAMTKLEKRVRVISTAANLTGHDVMVNFCKNSPMRSDDLTKEDLFQQVGARVWSADYYNEEEHPSVIYDQVLFLGEKVNQGIAHAAMVILPGHRSLKQTPNEMRHKAYQAVTAGANAIGWWDSPGCDGSEPMDECKYRVRYEHVWESISRISHELYEIMPGLTGTNPEYGRQGDIAYVRRTAPDGADYIMLVNLGADEEGFKFKKLQPGTVYEDMFNDGPGQIVVNDSGRLRGTVSGYSPAQGGILVLREVQP